MYCVLCALNTTEKEELEVGEGCMCVGSLVQFEA